jgi:zinc and cadmium transporter
LIPHAWHQLRSIDRVVWWMLGGFLVMFFLQRFSHFHHHDVPDEDPEGCVGTPQDSHCGCGHDHHHGGVSEGHGPVHHDHTLAGKSARQLSWGGAALGLTLHTLIDGMALAASVEAAASHGDTGLLLGFSTFLVIFLHKPFDAMVISTLMTAGGWSRASRHVVNGLFALAIPVGVLLFHAGAAQYVEDSHVFLGSALAFAGGTFLCIATSDLLPELQFHSHDRGKLSIALLLGLLLAAVVGKFESSGHDHHEPAVPAAESHDGHDH